MNLSKRVEAATDLQQLSVDLCAAFFRRDVDLNLGKRVEVFGSGFGNLQVDGAPFVELARHSSVVTKLVDLCSLSSLGQDLNVDWNKCVGTGKVLHSFCQAENPWSVLDPTVNLVFRVDDLELVRVRYMCCGELNAERCRVSAAPGCLDRGGTAVQCGLFFFFLQAYDRVMGLRRSSSKLASTRDFAHLDHTINASCLVAQVDAKRSQRRHLIPIILQ